MFRIGGDFHKGLGYGSELHVPVFVQYEGCDLRVEPVPWQPPFCQAKLRRATRTGTESIGATGA
jgi:hypothetical protein